MRDIVRERFYDFNAPLEGEVPYFYQDVLGLVSIGVGILCDPVRLAMSLPMVHPDGRAASPSDIAAEWTKIKALGTGDHEQGNPAARGGHLYAKPHTRLRLTSEGLRSTLGRKLAQNDVLLRHRFADFEEWPADAQLAIHSLSWGCGPAFRFPKCEAALRVKDFRTAAEECRMVANGVELYGLKPRNAANKLLLQNAALVHELGMNPDILYYPRNLTTDPVGAEDETLDEEPDFAVVHPPVPLYRIDRDPDDEPPAAA